MQKEHVIELKFTVNSNRDNQVTDFVRLLINMIKPSIEKFGAINIEIKEKEQNEVNVRKV